MFCRKCGSQIADTATKCTWCGEVVQPIAPIAPKPIETNLVLAIIVAVLCCMPFGIIGIVYASQVSGKVQAGDIAGAEEASRKSRLWSLWGLSLGLGLTIVMIAIGIAAEMASTQ